MSQKYTYLVTIQTNLFGGKTNEDNAKSVDGVGNIKFQDIFSSSACE